MVSVIGNNQDEQLLNNFCSDGRRDFLVGSVPTNSGTPVPTAKHDVSTSTGSTRNHFRTLHTAVSPERKVAMTQDQDWWVQGPHKPSETSVLSLSNLQKKSY